MSLFETERLLYKKQLLNNQLTIMNQNKKFIKKDFRTRTLYKQKVN